MSHQGLAAASDRDAVRWCDGSSAAMALYWLSPDRDGHQLAIELPIDTEVGPDTSASFRPDDLSCRGRPAGTSSASPGRHQPGNIAQSYAEGWRATARCGHCQDHNAAAVHQHQFGFDLHPEPSRW